MTTETHIGTTFGVAGFLNDAVRGCIKGLSLWQKSQDFGVEVVTFKIRFELQGSRFKAWAVEWDIDNGGHIEDPRFQIYGNVAINYVTLIHFVSQLLSSVEGSLEIPIFAPLAMSATALERLSSMCNEQEFERQLLKRKIEASQEDTDITQRLKWALEDGRAGKTLELLKSLIDELYQFFPPPNRDAATSAVMNASLASGSLSNLTALSHLDQGTDEATLISAIASIKTIEEASKERSESLQIGVVEEPWRMVSVRNEDNDKNNNRATGRYQGTNVFVEWKTVCDSGAIQAGLESRVQILAERVRQIARLLKSDNKPPELRTLDCKAVISQDAQGEKKFGLVFAMPSSNFFSLRKLLKDKGKLLSLNSRFRIAQVLSRAILYLHLGGWLHKGIRSENILFFADHFDAIDPAWPFLTGFEYSRLDEMNSLSEDLKEDEEFNRYRHPEAQGVPVSNTKPEGHEQIVSIEADDPEELKPEATTLLNKNRASYRKLFDFYSLGVILIELGRCESARRIAHDLRKLKDFPKTPQTAAEFQKQLLEIEIPKLEHSMGTTYAKTARLCISGEFDTVSRSLELAFFLDVVRQLESCLV